MKRTTAQTCSVVEAAYRAESGKLYTDVDHSGCLFAAQAAGEPELQWFPHGDTTDANFHAINERMGFVSDGQFLTRAETLERFGFDLAELNKP